MTYINYRDPSKIKVIGMCPRCHRSLDLLCLGGSVFTNCYGILKKIKVAHVASEMPKQGNRKKKKKKGKVCLGNYLQLGTVFFKMERKKK